MPNGDKRPQRERAPDLDFGFWKRVARRAAGHVADALSDVGSTLHDVWDRAAGVVPAAMSDVQEGMGAVADVMSPHAQEAVLYFTELWQDAAFNAADIPDDRRAEIREQYERDYQRHPEEMKALTNAFLQYMVSVPETYGEMGAVMKWMLNPNASYEDMPKGTFLPELVLGALNIPGAVQGLRDVWKDFHNDEAGLMTAMAGLGALPLLGAPIRWARMGGNVAENVDNIVRAYRAGQISLEEAGQQARRFGGHEMATELTRFLEAGGDVKHLEGGRTAVQQLPPEGTPRVTEGEAPVRAEHYGAGKLEGDVIEAAGRTRKTGQEGAEAARRKARPELYAERSWHYRAGTDPEARFRGKPMHTSDLYHVYDFDADPEGLLPIAEKMGKDMQIYEGQGVYSIAEQLAIERGYKGASRGNVINYFEDVRPNPVGQIADVDGAVVRHLDAGNEGATFDPRTGRNMDGEDAWAVSPFKDAELVMDNKPTAQELADYRARWGDRFEDESLHLGVWESDGKWYVDIVQLEPDYDKAFQIGVGADQQGIFNLKSHDYVEMGEQTERARTMARAELWDDNPHLNAIREETFRNNLTESERVAWDAMAETAGGQKIRNDALSYYTMMPTPGEGAAMAIMGAKQRGWYEASGNTLRTMLGDDAPRFTALLAATSPQNDVENNLAIAFEMWRRFKELPEGTEITLDLVRELQPIDMGLVPNSDKGILAAMTATDAELLDPRMLEEGGLLAGFKTDAFYANLMGEVQRLTLDTHMARYGAFGGSPTTVRRRLGQAGYWREVANEVERQTGVRLTPAEVQEMTWSTERAMYDLFGRGRTPIEEQMFGAVPDFLAGDAMDAVRMAIDETPSFASVLQNNPSIAGNLETLNLRVPENVQMPHGVPGFEARPVPEAAMRVLAQRAEDYKRVNPKKGITGYEPPSRVEQQMSLGLEEGRPGGAGGTSAERMERTRGYRAGGGAGRGNLYGQQAPGTRQLAEALHPYRSPKAEQIHMIVRDPSTGEILSHTYEGAGNYGQAGFPAKGGSAILGAAMDPNSPDGVRLYGRMKDRLDRIAAQNPDRQLEVVFAHNHPSGDVSASPADKSVIKYARDWIGGYIEMNPDVNVKDGGHLILDHDKVNIVRAHGPTGMTITGENVIGVQPKGVDWTKKGARAASKQELASFIRSSENFDPDSFAVAYIDSNGAVLAYEPHKMTALDNFGDWIHQRTRGHGAFQALLVAPMSATMSDMRHMSTLAHKHGLFDVFQLGEAPGDLRNATTMGYMPDPRYTGAHVGLAWKDAKGKTHYGLRTDQVDQYRAQGAEASRILREGGELPDDVTSQQALDAFVRDSNTGEETFWHWTDAFNPDTGEWDFSVFDKTSDIGYHFGTKEQAIARGRHMMGNPDPQGLGEFYLDAQQTLVIPEDGGMWAPEDFLNAMYADQSITRDEYSNLIEELYELRQSAASRIPPNAPPSPTSYRRAAEAEEWEWTRAQMMSRGYDSARYDNRGEVPYWPGRDSNWGEWYDLVNMERAWYDRVNDLMWQPGALRVADAELIEADKLTELQAAARGGDWRAEESLREMAEGQANFEMQEGTLEPDAYSIEDLIMWTKDTPEGADMPSPPYEESWIVLDPRQIKSVQNRGTFNPADPDFLKTVAPWLVAGGAAALQDKEAQPPAGLDPFFQTLLGGR
jgi:hypothetical protein